MKLSEIATGPTPTAQGWEGTEQAVIHAGEEKAYAAQQGGKMLGDIGHEANDVLDTINRVQLAKAAADQKTKDAQLRNELDNKKIYANMKEVDDAFGGHDNVPQSIKDQFGPDATNIPGFAVNGELYRKRNAENTAKAAENIQTPGWKDQFIRQGNQEGAFETERMKGEYQKEAQHFEVANADNVITKWINSGDFVSPVKFLNGELVSNGIKVPPPNISPEQKEKTLQLIKQAEGEYGMQVPMRGTDRALIKSTITGLESGANTFKTTDGTGKENMVDVSAISTDQRREKTRMLRQYLVHLDKADKEADKAFYAENDKALVVSLSMAEAQKGLGGMLQVQQEMFKTPSLYSESAFKYVRSAIEAKSNINYNRGQQYDPTLPDNKAYVAVWNGLSAGGGELVGPDGRKWGDLKTMDHQTLQNFSAEYGIKPERQVQLQKGLENLQKDHPVPSAELNTAIHTIISANGLVADDDDSEAAKTHRDALLLFGLKSVDSENARRTAAQQQPMNPKETKEFLEHVLTDPATGEKIQDGTTIFNNPRMVAAPNISGIPPRDLQMMAAVKGSLRSQYHTEPWGASGPQIAEAYYRIQKLLPLVGASQVAQKLKLSREDQFRYAAEIELQRSTIVEQLTKDLGRPPKDSELVQEFFLQKFPNKGLKDPRAEIIPKDDETYTPGTTY